jgi:hypothetical protein
MKPAFIEDIAIVNVHDVQATAYIYPAGSVSSGQHRGQRDNSKALTVCVVIKVLGHGHYKQGLSKCQGDRDYAARSSSMNSTVPMTAAKPFAMDTTTGLLSIVDRHVIGKARTPGTTLA